MRTMYSHKFAFYKFFRRIVKLFVLTFAAALLVLWVVGMRSIIDTISINQLEYLVTNIINNSVYDCMDNGDYTLDNLVNTVKNDKGAIAGINIDPYTANRMKSQIAAEITDRVNKISNDDLDITIGELVGYCGLGSWGPRLPLTVTPNGNVYIDFSQEFRSCGINQVKNTVLVDVTVEVSAMMPFFKNSSTVHSSVIVADTLIVGDVPETYIKFGEDTND